MTMFYSTIFATAMVLDAGAKTKRREEWENKIGEVKDEVKAMQNEEARILENFLSSRRRRGEVSASPLLRRRHYSTTAVRNAFAQPRNYQDETQPDGIVKNASLATFEPPLSESTPETAEESRSDDNPEPQVDDGFWVSNDPLRTRAIQQLATKQLVIRFMLRPTVASSYSGVHMGYPHNLELPKLNTNELLDELNSIRKRMNTLKKSESKTLDPLIQEISWRRLGQLREERSQLDDKLHSLLFQKSYDTSPHEILLKICDNLLSTEEPISSTAMSLLLQYFVRARENDLASIVLTSLLPAKIQITGSVIMNSIHYYSRSRDLYGFEGFLRRLQGFGGPVNMDRLWNTRRIGYVEIAVPPLPKHPFIFNALICAAIKFEQFQKADAWLLMMRQSGSDEDHSTLGAYLRSYGEKGDWEKGAPFLLRAVTYIMSSKEHKSGVIERLIVYMLAFCRNCRKTDLFFDIISAAVKNGFNWRLGHNKKDTSYLFQDVFKSWREATEKSVTSTTFDRTTAEKCQSFGTMIKESIQMTINNEKKGPFAGVQESKYQGGSNMLPDPSHIEEQKQLRVEVTSLKEEIKELRKMVERNNSNASSEGRLEPGSQLGEQRAAPADRLSSAELASLKKDKSVSPENAAAKVVNLKVPQQEPPYPELIVSGKRNYEKRPHLLSPSSTETKPHTSCEKHPILLGTRNRENFYTRNVWPVSGLTEVESKPPSSSPSPVTQHKSSSSPAPGARTQIRRVICKPEI